MYVFLWESFWFCDFSNKDKILWIRTLLIESIYWTNGKFSGGEGQDRNNGAIFAGRQRKFWIESSNFIFRFFRLRKNSKENFYRDRYFRLGDGLWYWIHYWTSGIFQKRSLKNDINRQKKLILKVNRQLCDSSDDENCICSSTAQFVEYIIYFENS